MKREIIQSLEKGEYDLAALGIGDFKTSKMIDAVTNIIEDMIEKSQDALIITCVKAILDDLKIWLDRTSKGDLSMTICLWEEMWEIPITYENFKYLEYEENDIEDEPKVEKAIDQLSDIVFELREHNSKVKWEEKNNV